MTSTRIKGQMVPLTQNLHDAIIQTTTVKILDIFLFFSQWEKFQGNQREVETSYGCHGRYPTNSPFKYTLFSP